MVLVQVFHSVIMMQNGDVLMRLVSTRAICTGSAFSSKRGYERKQHLQGVDVLIKGAEPPISHCVECSRNIPL